MSSSSSIIIRISQSRRARFQALTAERPAIVFVRAGEKLVGHSGQEVRIGVETLGILPARIPLSIENRPPSSGAYIASILLPDTDLIEAMMRDGLPDGDPFRLSTDDRARAAFERAADAIDDPLLPYALRENAVREVILWMVEAGSGFGRIHPRSFADRLRTLIAREPDFGWRAIAAARALAVSEATLRRRLADEGVTFRDLLMDVRMTYALGLLQSTDMPVNAVAFAVGYASPSRFSTRFFERFGIAPSTIRRSDARTGAGVSAMSD